MASIDGVYHYEINENQTVPVLVRNLEEGRAIYEL